MNAKLIITGALEQCLRDEANGVELFPAYNRLKAACERALEELHEAVAPRPISTVSVCGREIIQPVINALAWVTGVPTSKILSAGRVRAIANTRHAGYYILRTRTALSLGEIGRVFGRDHSTVLHGVNAAKLDKESGGERWRIVKAVEAKLWPESVA